MKSLIEAALREVLAQERERRPFRLRKATFGGEGLHPEVQDADWSEIRRRAYEGRGG